MWLFWHLQPPVAIAQRCWRKKNGLLVMTCHGWWLTRAWTKFPWFLGILSKNDFGIEKKIASHGRNWWKTTKTLMMFAASRPKKFFHSHVHSSLQQDRQVKSYSSGNWKPLPSFSFQKRPTVSFTIFQRTRTLGHCPPVPPQKRTINSTPPARSQRYTSVSKICGSQAVTTVKPLVFL